MLPDNKEKLRTALPTDSLDRMTQAAADWFPQAAFEQPGLALAVLDGETRVRKISRGLRDLLGRDSADFESTCWAEWVAEPDRLAVEESLGRLLAGNATSLAFECRYVAKSGDLHWCSTVALPWLDETHAAKALVLFVLEATGKKQLEEEYRQIEQQLLVAQKMESLGLLVGGMAHDFNNFLEVILGFASLARLRVPRESDLYEPLQMIEESARRASELTAHLLDLVREGGSPGEAANPDAVLHKVAKIVRRTFDRKIRIETRWEPGLPWIRGDARQLEQAILNLAINARDAMPDGGTLSLVASRASLTAEDRDRPPALPPGDYVRIAVEDTGSGMEASVLERIFDPLFTTKPPDEGTGLGLTMVRRIVRDAGGNIEVRSEPGRGSLFTLFFPVAEAPLPAAEHAPSPSLVRGRGTVLVVEDEPVVLAFVERGLRQLGYTVLTAVSGREACGIYSHHAEGIDCVLLDMIMPEMSGLETYARLKAIRPDVKVILSSGYSRKRFTGDLAETDFLGKPYSLQALSLAIDEKIRGR
jgi:two-component system cell cycle sensor histidine kinase/response regulator CckA